MLKTPKKRLAFTLLLILVVGYSVSLSALFLSQRSFMYHPDIGTQEEFLAMAQELQVLPWHSADGEQIGWKRLPEQPAKYRMIILHGNGGSAISRTYLMDGFDTLGGWEFYALEYPGYAWCEGVPSENAIVGAAEDALLELHRLDSRPLFVTGESLGSGVAALLAARQPQIVDGLFLVTPYTSTADVAAGRFPFFPVRLLMQDRYDAATALQEYSGPVGFLLAGNDYIVPTRFGQALFDNYHGPKKLWLQPDAGHNSLDFSPSAKWWREAGEFLTHRNKKEVLPVI